MNRLTKKEREEQKKLEWQKKLKKEKRNKKLKQIGLWTGTAAILLLSVFGLIKLAGSSQTTSNISSMPRIAKSDITIGNPNSKLTLVEYADFQCPACAAYHPIVNQLLSDFKGRIYYAYRFFPLTQLHQNAMISAQAAYASYLQGKFFDMYNMLFDTQASWANLENDKAKETFISYAKKLNLNLDKFKKDINSQATKDFINNEQNQGVNIGVNSTPTFFLNGKFIQNPMTYDEFKKLVYDALNQK